MDSRRRLLAARDDCHRGVPAGPRARSLPRPVRPTQDARAHSAHVEDGEHVEELIGRDEVTRYSSLTSPVVVFRFVRVLTMRLVVLVLTVCRWPEAIGCPARFSCRGPLSGISSIRTGQRTDN